MNMNRRVAALAVVAALSLGGPLAAAGWERPAREVGSGDFLSGEIFTRFLAWLGFRPALEGVPKRKSGSSNDPKSRPHTAAADSASSDAGMGIDPNGGH
ncbi:MAG: hypothetical protein JF614_06445 [Acidobacteria bacterium]|nr:hypothetical protein [Acidobacteriota bacterium]